MADETLPVELARRIDQCCDRFERLWHEDPKPSLEEFLRDIALEEKPVFFEALLKLEFELQSHFGHRPSLETYARRFPGQEELVESLYLQQFQLTAAHTGYEIPLARDFPSKLPIFDRFRTIKRIGQGGMGVVYLASDEQIERQVAVKVICREHWNGSQEINQFLTEARAMGALLHPHVVSIFSVGRHEVGPYIVMEYVAGGTLANYIAKKLPSNIEAAQLMIGIAKGVEFAHSQGIIHRDLKPSNILLTDQLEPKVADFGLAKWVSEESISGEGGLVVGTPNYMSPEQARGFGPVGPSADVYGLGAILYELLSGRPPFRGPSPIVTIDQVRQLEPVSPIRLQPSISVDLNTICLKCLRKEPEQRYPTVGELREDLQRYLDGRPILARPVSTRVRIYRWMKRNPTLSLLSATTIVAILLGLIGTLWQLHRAQTNLTVALREKELHEQNFSRALDTVDFLTQISSQELVAIPQAKAIRSELLQTAEKYYRQFIAERPTGPELSHGLCLILLRLGQIRNELGMQSEAISAYREGISILKRLLQANPQDAVALKHLAGSAQNLAGILRFYGAEHLAEAIELQRTSVVAWNSITADLNCSNESLLEFSKSTFSLGVLLYDQGLVEEARTQIAAAMQILDRIPLPHTSSQEAQIIRARCLSQLANYLEDEQKWSDSKQLHTDAAKICIRIVEQNPSSSAALMESADVHNNLAIVLKRLGEGSSARAAYSTAKQNYESLLLGDSNGAIYLDGLSRTLYNMGILDSENQQLESAIAFFERSVKIQMQLQQLAPGNSAVQTKLKSRLRRLIAAQIASGDIPKAVVSIRLRLSLWPNDPDEAWLVATEINECLRQQTFAEDSKNRSPEISALHSELVGLAVSALKNAIVHAPERKSQIAIDPQLDCVRASAELTNL